MDLRMRKDYCSMMFLFFEKQKAKPYTESKMGSSAGEI